MKYLKEQLAPKENFNFRVIRGGMDDLIPRLDILADTLYLKVFVCSHNVGERPLKHFRLSCHSGLRLRQN